MSRTISSMAASESGISRAMLPATGTKPLIEWPTLKTGGTASPPGSITQAA